MRAGSAAGEGRAGGSGSEVARGIRWAIPTRIPTAGKLLQDEFQVFP